MSIVLKEHEWTENMIQSRTLGKKPFETLSRVARYYIDKGYSKKDTRNMLDSFLLQCNPTCSLPKWSDRLDFAVNRALKYNAVDIDSIDITAPEMDKIRKLEGKQIQRLAFTLLCLAKYWLTVEPHRDYWVHNKDNEIMSLANINTSIKRQGMMYRNLKAVGMIQFSRKVDNTNVRVCFAEDGITVMQITDFRNLGYQYLKYCGEPYFECQNCGITTKISNPVKGKKQKYCKSCAAEIAVKQRVNSVMKNRNKTNSSNSVPKLYTIYMHQSPNRKRYIGMTSTSLCCRWKKGVGYIDNQNFYSDILKFGWDNIKHYKITSTTNEKEARKIESFYIQKYKTDSKKHGYNRASGAVVHSFDNIISNNCSIKEVDGLGNELK